MSACARCGALFGCAMADAAPAGASPAAPCWCTHLPAAVPVPPAAADGPGPDAGCWCPDCLRRRIDAMAAAATTGTTGTIATAADMTAMSATAAARAPTDAS